MSQQPDSKKKCMFCGGKGTDRNGCECMKCKGSGTGKGYPTK